MQARRVVRLLPLSLRASAAELSILRDRIAREFNIVRERGMPDSQRRLREELFSLEFFPRAL